MLGRWSRPAPQVYLMMAAVSGTAASIVFTLSQVYRVTIVGLNPFELVMVGTLMELTVLIFEVPTGVVADIYSRRLSILTGFALLGIAWLIEGFFPVFPAVLAGAGVKTGQVIGKTTSDCVDVVDHPVSAGDFFATICKALDIDPEETYEAAGRPVPYTAIGSEPIKMLF